MASEEWIKKLYENGQIATQLLWMQTAMFSLTTKNGMSMVPTMQSKVSQARTDVCLVRWLMQRDEEIPLRSISYGEQDMKIFESGVAYFK